MTAAVYSGLQYVSDAFEITLQVQDLREGEWVTVETKPFTPYSFVQNTIWVGRRIVISEHKKVVDETQTPETSS